MSDTEELSPQYDPRVTEPAIYDRWMRSEVFRARPERSRRVGGDREPFTIVMPPPNVTAILHVGHGLNNAVQDVIIRWRRMAGDEALWLPGTDHAGIATQNVVEKLIASEGSTRYDLGREAFVERTRRFVEETGGEILNQLRALGASADWSRTAYTLTPELSLAVREAFVRLYEDGLIYRGHRVIHWCPRCLTSLSDEEAEHADTTGSLYYIQYPLASGDGAIMVATTRPETMLGDVGVAVHPEDERYGSLVGAEVMLPIVNVRIPVVADDAVDPAFGTGAVKLTPAHDANDFEMAKRHNLPMPVIMSPTATMEEGVDGEGRVPAALRGLDRFEARERIVQMLRALGLLVKVESHQHGIRHCYRCDTVVEPRLSDQWFVKMAPLAKPALEAVQDGRVRVLPERWEAVYINWMSNIRDWNISRQLWWGHRIPVWYCDSCGWQNALREDPTACPKCKHSVRQDEDVLDTWFSSWLWPFSTLGWPQAGKKGAKLTQPAARSTQSPSDLEAFYPTDVLTTAPEILFFWVARMIMGGMYFLGDPPFHSVYLHGTVRDTQHRKMSKSLGNGIDPLDVVALYGADALRFTLIAGMGMGADVILDPADIEKSFAPGRNFITKLWNIGRFLLSNLGTDPVRPLSELDRSSLTRADRWILDRLDNAIRECDGALGPAHPPGPPDQGRWPAAARFTGLRLNEYSETARRFVWNELADWYVEAIKQRVAKSGADREVARTVLLSAFDAALRMLHPIVPFVTEALWQRLPGHGADEMLASSAWPRVSGLGEGATEFETVRAVIVGIRQIRSDYNIPPATILEASIVAEGASRAVLTEEAALIGQLARCRCSVVATAPTEPGANVVLPNGIEIVVPLAGLVDLKKECGRVKGELEQLEKQLTGLEQRLTNEKFMSRAPANVVEAEREKQREWSARREHLSRKVRALCGD